MSRKKAASGDPITNLLSRNLRAAMAYRDVSQNRLMQLSGVAQSTIGRTVRGESAVAIDSLSLLARALEFEIWQLLLADFDPANPPTLRQPTERERAFYTALNALIKERTK